MTAFFLVLKVLGISKGSALHKPYWLPCTYIMAKIMLNYTKLD